MKTILEFLEKYKVSKKPLNWLLDRVGRDELERFISEQRLEAKREHAQRLKEVGIIDFSKLDKREQEVMERWLMIEDLETIGKRMGVTRERVRQVEAKALEKLRAN